MRDRYGIGSAVRRDHDLRSGLVEAPGLEVVFALGAGAVPGEDVGDAGADAGVEIQEVLGFGVFYSYLNCENPDEVDWVVRKIKQLSLVERKELDKKLMEGSI